METDKNTTNEIDLNELTIPYITLVDSPPKDVAGVQDFMGPHAPLAFSCIPKSIMQLWMSQSFYLELVNSHLPFSPNLGFSIDTHSYAEFSQMIGQQKYIVGIVMSANCEQFIKAIVDSKIPYFLICNSDLLSKIKDRVIPAANVAFNLAEFTKKFSIFIINEILNGKILDRNTNEWFIKAANPKAILPQDEFNIPNFNPILCNEFTTGQISGETWYNQIKFSIPTDPMNRAPLIVESVKRLDEEHTAGVKIITSEQFKSRKRFRYQFQPIILSLPYINKRDISRFYDIVPPPGGNRFDRNAFKRGLKAEQNPDSYMLEDTIESSENNQPLVNSFKAGNLMKGRKINALDTTSYLHSSLTFSPYYRGPFTGNSVSYYLRYFDPEFFLQIKDKKKMFNQVKLLGEAIANRLHVDFKIYLASRNGIVVSISDLPLEVATLNNVPLFFKYDHCRIPETSYASQLSQYSRHTYGGYYSIPTDIIKKTLVVCLVPKDPIIFEHFENARKLAENSKLRDIVWATAETIEELKRIVEDIKPELLVLDTHGVNREQHSDSVLSIGDGVLTGDDIVKHEIAAPLVVLSACLTAPTYGYMNPLAHAFFEAGALSVLSTILPVKITEATVLYYRILNNLSTAANTSIHDNWCDFVSHNLRTSIYSDYERHVLDKIKISYKREDDWAKKKADWQMKSLFFAERENCFHNLFNHIASTFDEGSRAEVISILNRSNIVPEAYFYTLLGRADLIKFDSYDVRE